MTRLQATFLALSLTTALTGCPIYGDGDGGDRPEFCVGAGCPCDAIDDCSRGFRCDVDRRMCEDATGCTNDTDCPTGEVCDTAFNVCVPGVPPTTCRTNGDCPSGEYCAAGICTRSSICTDDSSCSSGGFVCDFRSTCVPPGACRSNADCTGGSLCIEGACRAPSTTCQFNYECGAGRACVDNTCVNLCTAASQCASGQNCRSGFCEADPTECTASSQCGANFCVDGRCLPNCRSASCSGASDSCGVDEFCRPTWEPSPFCTTDAQCAGGSVCRDGVCRTPCPTGTSMQCQTFDVQLPICQMATGSTEFLCYATNERTPECAVRSECSATESCIDAICRNRT